MRHTPEVAEAYRRRYSQWLNEIERYSFDPDTVAICHSSSCGFLLKWFTENKIRIKQLILVAPYLDPGGNKYPDLQNFEIDSHLDERIDSIHVFYSQEDDEVRESIKLVREVLPDVDYHEFKDGGHFNLDAMGTEEFPELLEVIGG